MKFYVPDRKKILRNLLITTYFLGGLIGSQAWFGHKEYELKKDKIEYQIQQFVEKQNYDEARTILFNDSELNLKDKTALKKQIDELEEFKTKSQLEGKIVDAIKINDRKRLDSLIRQIKKETRINEKELNSLLFENSDSLAYLVIQKNDDLKQKDSLRRLFLQKYGFKNDHGSEIKQDLVNDLAQVTLDTLLKYEGVFNNSSMKMLDSLEQTIYFGSFSKDQRKIYPNKKLRNKLKAYLKNILSTDEVVETTLKLGFKVKIKKNTEFDNGYGTESYMVRKYIKYPIGSEGIIVNKSSSEDKFVLYFPDKDTTSKNKSKTALDLMKKIDDSKPIACYTSYELTSPRRFLNPIEIKLLANYYFKITGEHIIKYK